MNINQEEKKYKKRAMTSEKASFVKLQGHKDAIEFAKLIGLNDDYKNDPQAKKDVIDFNGDAHSVKSGENKWQIFLYGKTRFETDNAFKAMNGIGHLMQECINCIPENKDEYKNNKILYKTKLQRPMFEICNKLQEKYRLEAFLDKSIFNGGEVNYLTIKDNNKFHIFLNKDVIKILSDNFIVENSKARNKNQMSNLKVIFKINKTFGEIEMRNGEKSHHREIKFWLKKKFVIDLLQSQILDYKNFNDKVVVYGKAIKKFIKDK